MTALAEEMRTTSRTACSRLYKKEEKDFEVKLAAWRKRQDEKARQATAQLPGAIKEAAKNRMSCLIVRVETRHPFLYSETLHAYQEFRTQWADDTTLESGTRVTLSNSRYLPRGCRPIARWALRQKFAVRVVEWETSEFPWRTALVEIDCFNSRIVPRRDPEYPIYTGLSISW